MLYKLDKIRPNTLVCIRPYDYPLYAVLCKDLLTFFHAPYKTDNLLKLLLRFGDTRILDDLQGFFVLPFLHSLEDPGHGIRMFVLRGVHKIPF